MIRSIESDHGLISLFEHDLLGKPVPTFPDHAPDQNSIDHSAPSLGDALCLISPA
jgi:hypothetical protein